MTQKKGVDYSDQMTAYYSPLRKTRKWYKKCAFEPILCTGVVNAHILYNKFHAKTPMPLKLVGESLVLHCLTGKETEDINVGKDRTTISGKRSAHALTEMDGRCKDTRKRCRGCYDVLSKNEGYKVANNKARRVKTYCFECEGKPFLSSYVCPASSAFMKRMTSEKCHRVCVDRIKISCLFLKGLLFFASYWAR